MGTGGDRVTLKCPVPLDTRVWISSPGAAVQNLVLAGRLPAEQLGTNRVLDVPGLTTPAEMLDSLGRLVGLEARARVALTDNARTEAIVCSWPGAFDAGRAASLGFVADRSFDDILQQYLNETPAA